jgi:hypothetical protein
MASLFRHNPVLELLETDHTKVKGLFEQFKKHPDLMARSKIVRDTLDELKIHAAI